MFAIWNRTGPGPTARPSIESQMTILADAIGAGPAAIRTALVMGGWHTNPENRWYHPDLPGSDCTWAEAAALALAEWRPTPPAG